MARINNLTNFLIDVATAIKTKKGTTDPIPAENFDIEILSIFIPTLQSGKVVEPTISKIVVNPDEGFDGFDSFTVNPVTSAIDENIIAENIAEGKTILGVEGTAKVLDTFDATATSGDIAYGKTAYANGSKIIGDLFTHPSGEVLFKDDRISKIEETANNVTATGAVISDRILRITTPGTIQLNKMQLAEAINLTPDKIGKGQSVLGIEGTLESAGSFQEKEVNITKDGLYIINPDEDYDALSVVTVNVSVAGSMETQHMPFYLLESDDDGNLWCINNYATIEYSPYSLDVDGSLILTQDDTDTAVYWINENMELEVEVYG